MRPQFRPRPARHALAATFPLRNFADWLRQRDVRGSAVYVSGVRRILAYAQEHGVDLPSAELLRDYDCALRAGETSRASTSARYTARRGWALYREFAAEQGVEVAPYPQARSIARPSDTFCVGLARIYTLAPDPHGLRVPINTLRAYVWRTDKLNGAYTLGVSSDPRRVIWSESLTTPLEQCITWAWPNGIEQNKPVFPWQPEADTPMSERALRRALLRGQELIRAHGASALLGLSKPQTQEAPPAQVSSPQEDLANVLPAIRVD